MNTRTIRSPSDIKAMVCDGKRVNFVRFQSGQLWYATQCGFEFPVPVAETGQAPYLATDKALLFMRFIRKHIQLIQSAMAHDQQAPEPPMAHRPPC